MSINTIFSTLPFELIREILLYDSHFIIRKKKHLICINKISKHDFRFQLLSYIPKIYELSHNSWRVILGKDKKYIIGHYLRPSNIWEYSFIIYSKDPHTNMMDNIPDSIICIPLFP